MAAEISVTLAVTGHRPDKLGGWKTPNPIYHQVIQKLRETFEMFKPTLVITGMALGVDQWAAQVCIDLGIPFYAAIPFQDQDKIWPQAAKAKYQYLLSRAAGATIVSPGEYAAYKLQVRNQWMVDRCHQLIAVWNGWWNRKLCGVRVEDSAADLLRASGLLGDHAHTEVLTSTKQRSSAVVFRGGAGRGEGEAFLFQKGNRGTGIPRPDPRP